ncbi:MAG: hypothetical protein QF442_02500, partial [Candidatus Peribacteraceae bacterium]|nr:hypothetical protein [Candidatus Peribacteraceae bacterium]
MNQRRHHRRRYGAHQDRQRKARIGKLASMAVLAILLVVISNKTLEFFGVGNAIRRTAAILEIEDRGVINVSVDNGPLKRAENDLKLYAGDMLVSSPRNYATLTLFDDSVVRLDESTQLRTAESIKGEETSKVTL